MQIVIADVLSQKEVKAARLALKHARFVDGRTTAGFAARQVKRNLQVDRTDRSLDAQRKLIADKIISNELFRLAARPKALTPLLLSRYVEGMHYGSHVDDAMIGGMRTDVSFTLFLSDPESYDGGELVLESTAGEDAIKLAAGSLVAYPSTTLHRVNDVARGERLAAVGWARSLIRDPSKRELLFDLDTARRRMFAREGNSADYDLIGKSLANLWRMWSED
jgi:PKHD-type hydroxylase